MSRQRPPQLWTGQPVWIFWTSSDEGMLISYYEPGGVVMVVMNL